MKFSLPVSESAFLSHSRILARRCSPAPKMTLLMDIKARLVCVTRRITTSKVSRAQSPTSSWRSTSVILRLRPSCSGLAPRGAFWPPPPSLPPPSLGVPYCPSFYPSLVQDCSSVTVSSFLNSFGTCSKMAALLRRCSSIVMLKSIPAMSAIPALVWL